MILEPIYDSRLSFYGKASTETTRNDFESTTDLYSYNTLVASVIRNYEKKIITYKIYGKYSKTTTRHQKEFLKQNGLLSDIDIKKVFKDMEITKDM